MCALSDPMHITQPMLIMMRKMLQADRHSTNDELNAIALALICVRQGQAVPENTARVVDNLRSRVERLSIRQSRWMVQG